MWRVIFSDIIVVMLKKRLLIISLLLILFIAAFHFFALKYDWYWTYRWLDIPLHLIGGFWVSLTALWICLEIKHIDNIYEYKKKSLFIMLASVLIIAFFWEIFELIFKVTSLHSVGYWQDSVGDIVNGFVGGVIAFLFFIRSRKATHHLIEKSVIKNFGVVL